jgi:hypothetical protein
MFSPAADDHVLHPALDPQVAAAIQAQDSYSYGEPQSSSVASIGFGT